MPASNRRPLYSHSDVEQAPAGPMDPAHEGLSSGGGGGGGGGDGAQQLDADAPPRLLTMQPCTVKGLAAALSAGMLGYLFGFVPGVIRHRASKWALVHLDGVRSAQSFAVMSGAYTAVHCICQRIRQVEDSWNRGVAGCATGLALGWSNGPMGAVQSCLGIGGLSYLLDFGGTGAAEARLLAPTVLHQQHQHQQQRQQQKQQQKQRRRRCRKGDGAVAETEDAAGRAPRAAGSGACSSGALRPAGGLQRRQAWELEQRLRALVAAPPLAFLGECFRVAYFDGCGGAGAGALAGGCSAWPAPARRAAAAGRSGGGAAAAAAAATAAGSCGDARA